MSAAEKVEEIEIAYYRQADAFIDKVSVEELLVWYSTLSLQAVSRLATRRITQWVQLRACKRYLLEKRGFCMRSFMLANLAPQEVVHWLDDAGQASSLD